MTVINHDARNQYVATSGQTIFNYGFEIAANTDLKVYQRAMGSVPDDALDLLTLGVDYTVTNVGGEDGGSIVLVTGAVTGDIVTIQGNAPAERDTTFTPGGVIQAQNLNTELDNDVLIYQTILALLNNLVPRYQTSAIVQDFELVLPNLGANEAWVMNDDATEIVTNVLLSAADLASHEWDLGASLIGLYPEGTVQDLADSRFILQVESAAAPNAQALGNLASGVLKSSAGSGVVSISPSLTSMDAVSTGVDEILYTTDVNQWAATGLTAYMRTLLDDVSAVEARATLGVIIGTSVQAYNDNLESISALGTAADRMIYTTALHTWAESPLTAFSRSLLELTDPTDWQDALQVAPIGNTLKITNNLSELTPTASTARANIGLTIGTDVQAYNINLQGISALGTNADIYVYTTATNVWAQGTITPYMRLLLEDANAVDAADTLEVLPLAGGTMTGDLILNNDPTIGSQAATKSYVDNKFQNLELACLVVTPSDLTGYTYSNGVSGIGATLTAGSVGEFVADGVMVPIGQRVLVNFQVNQAWQGPYTLTVSSPGSPAVLTRATDYDQPADMQAGDQFSVVDGTLYAASQWMMSQVNPITVGTTPITFQQIAGSGALLKANNLSDLPSVGTARANLGLVIGTNVQAYDATLQSISGLGTAADKIIYTTGVDTWSETAITTFGRSLIDDANAAAAQTTLGLVVGTNVQAQDATLQSIAALGTAADKYLYTTGVDTWAEGDITAFGRTIVNLSPANNGLLVTGNTGTPSILAGPGAAGKVLQSNTAAAPSYSTATYPAVATGTGKILRADGTNWVPSTATYPDLASTAGYVLTSDGTNFVSSPPSAVGGLSAINYLLMGA